MNASLMLSNVHLPKLFLILLTENFIDIIVNITNGFIYPLVIFIFIFSDALIIDECCLSVIPLLNFLPTDFSDFSLGNSIGFLPISSCVKLKPCLYFSPVALINTINARTKLKKVIINNFLIFEIET